MKRLITLLLSLGVMAQLSAQECLTNAVESTPDEEFSPFVTGTVLHIPTGLIWQRCAVGQNLQRRSRTVDLAAGAGICPGL